MNAAYWLAIIWGMLGVIAILFTKGRNATLVCLLAAAAAVASLLGVALQYHLL